MLCGPIFRDIALCPGSASVNVRFVSVDDLQRTATPACSAGAPARSETGRPMNVPFAPSASAFSRSCPERMPPSINTSVLAPTARCDDGSATRGSTTRAHRPGMLPAVIGDDDRIGAVRHRLRRVVGIEDALDDHRPSWKRFFTQAITSVQLSGRGRTGSAIQVMTGNRGQIRRRPCAWPTTLPKVRLLAPSMPSDQAAASRPASSSERISRGSCAAAPSCRCGCRHGAARGFAGPWSGSAPSILPPWPGRSAVP